MVTTQRDPAHYVADNLLKQDFAASRPNQYWAADITYIATHQGWLYLAVVADLYSCRIVSRSMNSRVDRDLPVDALTKALGDRRPQGTLLHYSDRGPQYTSDDFRDVLKKDGTRCSMSARGSWYNNAAVESFFSLLKRERVRRQTYKTRKQARPISLIISSGSMTENEAILTWAISVQYSMKTGH